MKKFGVTVLILLILGGVAFFFGWAQLTVSPGAYGVMTSKTHGADQHVIQSGEFRWVWYKLIPTNVEINVFRLNPIQRQVNVQGVLPSGNLYTAFAGSQVDFSWDITASFTFTLRPDRLISIISQNSITDQKGLTLYEEHAADSIEAYMLRYLTSGENVDIEQMLAGSSAELEQHVRGQFPDIDTFSCIIKNVRLPDLILYEQIRGLYEIYIARQQDYIIASMNQKAEERINKQIWIDEMDRTGAVLSRYPILLDYLSLERGLPITGNRPTP